MPAQIPTGGRLGIDVGGVLAESVDTDAGGGSSSRDDGGDDGGSSSGQPKKARRSLPVQMQEHGPTEVCVATVAGLVRLFGANNVFIVSKCGAHMQRATVVWLNHYEIFQRTGIRPENVCFCTNRSGIEGVGTDLSWKALDPPQGDRLAELAAATGRSTSEVESFFGAAQGAMAAAPLPGRTGFCGKGVLARALQLTHFIDDRAECLHSVFFEGWLSAGDEEEEAAGDASAAATIRGLATAPTRGAMIHFGPAVKSKKIAKKPESDADLSRLLPYTTLRSISHHSVSPKRFLNMRAAV